MNDDVAGFLVLLMTDSLRFVIAAGLCACPVLLWRPRLAGKLAAIQSGLVAVAAAVLVPCMMMTNSVVIVEFGSWLTLSSVPAAGLPWTLQLDIVSAVLLFSVSGCVLLSVFREKLEFSLQATDSVRRDEYLSTGSLKAGLQRFLFLQLALQFVLAVNPVIQVGLMQLMAVCFLMPTGSEETDSNHAATTARRTFLFRFLGDGLLLGAIGMSVTSDSSTVVGLLLLAGVLMRSAAYPFFRDDDVSERNVLEYVLVLTAGVVFLMRTQSFFDVSATVKHAMLVSGMGLAVLGGAVAAVRGRHGILKPIAISQLGILLAGVGGGTIDGLQGVTLLLVSQALILPLILRPDNGNGRSSGGLMLLWGTGVCGQGMIITALSSGDQFVVAGLLGLSHALTAFAMGRHFRAAKSTTSSALSAKRLPRIVVAVISIGIVALIVAAHWTTGVLVSGTPEIGKTAGPWQTQPFEHILVAIPGGIGMTAGWMRREKTDQLSVIPSTRSRVIFGLIRHGFLLDNLLMLLVVFPLRTAAQLCRFFEWFIIERLWNIPARLLEWFNRVGEPLRTESIRLSVVTILLATTALLGIIVVLGN